MKWFYYTEQKQTSLSRGRHYLFLSRLLSIRYPLKFNPEQRLSVSIYAYKMRRKIIETWKILFQYNTFNYSHALISFLYPIGHQWYKSWTFGHCIWLPQGSVHLLKSFFSSDWIISIDLSSSSLFSVSSILLLSPFNDLKKKFCCFSVWNFLIIFIIPIFLSIHQNFHIIISLTSCIMFKISASKVWQF